MRICTIHGLIFISSFTSALLPFLSALHFFNFFFSLHFNFVMATLRHETEKNMGKGGGNERKKKKEMEKASLSSFPWRVWWADVASSFIQKIHTYVRVSSYVCMSPYYTEMKCNVCNVLRITVLRMSGWLDPPLTYRTKGKKVKSVHMYFLFTA